MLSEEPTHDKFIFAKRLLRELNQSSDYSTLDPQPMEEAPTHVKYCGNLTFI